MGNGNKNNIPDLSTYDVSIDLFTAISRLKQFNEHASKGKSRAVFDSIGFMDVKSDVTKCINLLEKVYSEFMNKAFPGALTKADDEEEK
jgi:hypothetical protein